MEGRELFDQNGALVTEGGEDSEGTFHRIAEFRDSLLAKFFKREVFALLLGEELISEAVVENIASWRHSGFSVHSQVRSSTKKEAERVGKYMIRPLLSLERLSFSEKEGKVSYRYGKQTEDEELMDYADFCRLEASASPDCLSGTLDGRRDRLRVLCLIFSLTGRRGPGDFRRF